MALASGARAMGDGPGLSLQRESGRRKRIPAARRGDRSQTASRAPQCTERERPSPCLSVAGHEDLSRWRAGAVTPPPALSLLEAGRVTGAPEATRHKRYNMAVHHVCV